MFTEEQLKTYLENMSPNTDFIQFEFINSEKFNIQLKCEIDKNKSKEFYSAYIDKWMKSFSKFTATIWSPGTSYVKLKTQLLHRSFVCQPSDCGKSKVACDARVEFKVKLIDANADLFTAIAFSHSHDVYSSPATALGDPLSDTDKLFFEYFDNGFNATTSKTYHELSLIEKYGTRCSPYLADEDLNPTIDHIKILIDKMHSKEIQRSFCDILEAKKAFIKDSGGTLMYHETPELVVVITPLMKKVILNSSLDCILVDTSLVKIGLVVTYFYISNKIGALPVACVLHTAATETNFKEAFKLLKFTIHTVNQSFNPKIFIVNDLAEQKAALALFFPQSKLIVSRWSICSEVWKRLCNDDLKIDHRRRHSLMFLFKSMICASADDSHAHYKKLIVSDYFDSRIRLREYIDYLWGRASEWMVKDKFTLHNLTEVSLRLLKEFMLRKCRFFNIIMMIDIVFKLLENHLKTLINTYIDGMPTMTDYTKFFYRSYAARSNEDFVQIRTNEYMVQYQTSPNLYYHVKTDTCCCDCAIGKQGRLCDHLGIIFNNNSERMLNIPLLTNIEVDVLMKFLGLSNDNNGNKRCALLEDEENFGAVDGATNLGVDQNTVYLNKYQRDCVEDTREQTVAKSKNFNKAKPHNFYVLKKFKSVNNNTVKIEPGYGERLEAPKAMAAYGETNGIGGKRKPNFIEFYMNSLNKLNDQFQKLVTAYQKNPNASNLASIDELAKELAKIAPRTSHRTGAGFDMDSKGKKKRLNE